MANVKTFSLLDHTVSFALSNKSNLFFKEANGTMSNSMSLNALGSFLGKISVTKDEPNITKTADATGGVVFSYSHNHSGKCEFEFSYVSEYVLKLLTALYDKYVGSNAPENWRKVMLDITISAKSSPTDPTVDTGIVAWCSGCYLEKMPDLEIGSDVGTRTFSFLVADVQYAKQ